MERRKNLRDPTQHKTLSSHTLPILFFGRLLTESALAFGRITTQPTSQALLDHPGELQPSQFPGPIECH